MTGAGAGWAPGAGATLLDLFRARLQEDPEAEAVRFVPARVTGAREAARAKGGEVQIERLTRRELESRAKGLAAGLLGLAPEPGARCAIVCETRVEWVVADLACVMAGLISVPLFPNVDPETVARVLEVTECRLAIVENPWQARKLLDVAARVGGPERRLAIVLVDETMTLASGATATLDELARAEPATSRLTLAALERTKPGALLAERMEDVEADACATLCYTPGTEGLGKAVIWTHANMVAVAAALGVKLRELTPTAERRRRGAAQPDEVVLLTLPLAQALGRAVLWLGLTQGFSLALPRSDSTSLEDAAALAPTVVIGVPSLFDRARGEVLRQLRAGGPLPAMVSRWAAQPPPGKGGRGLFARLRDGLVDRVVAPALERRFGPRARVFVSSGAPLRDGVQAFFLGHGIALREAYGLVETAAVTHLDAALLPTAGTVGRPLPGVEQRVGEDGELFVRGPQVSPGYWRDAEATRRKVDDDGWFATGDLATLDAEGRLVITGRKREMIVLSNGRTLALRPIERQLGADPLVACVMVHGDGRDFATALVALDGQELDAFAAAHGLAEAGSFEALTRHPKVHAHIEQLVARVNLGLPSHAQIRKFAILPVELTPEAPELTPHGTLRRALVAERHRPLLDSFYAESF